MIIRTNMAAAVSTIWGSCLPGVFVVRAVLCGIYVRAADFWKLPLLPSEQFEAMTVDFVTPELMIRNLQPTWSR